MLKLDYNYYEDIELELTTTCNAKCSLCARNYNNFKTKYPETKTRDLSEIIKQLELFTNLKIVRLVGSISEPTLYPYFFELISYLNVRKILIEICTNGDTNNHEWWKKLGNILKHEDKVYFTICGSTQEIHEIYRINTNLKNILLNAEFLRSEKNIDYAQCIMFKYNEDDLKSDKFKELIKCFSNIYFTETYLKSNNSKYKNQINIEQVGPPTHREKLYNLFKKLSFKEMTKIDDYNCMSLQNKSLQIDINGKIFPCYLYLENNITWNNNYSSIINNPSCNLCKKNVSVLITSTKSNYII